MESAKDTLNHAALREERTELDDAALREERTELDDATAVMERLANRAIERLIRRGFVETADVTQLRKQDAKCRRLVAELEQ